MENYTYNPLSGEWDKVGTVYNGDIINNPDNEDITVDDNNQLKLADRTAVSGKGYKILRRGVDLQTQFSQENTIYEVRYDYDLNSGTLNIPDKCTLKFEGGSFKNGTLKGNNTFIAAALDKIFDNIITTGTFSNESAYAEWFADTSKVIGTGSLSTVDYVDCTEGLQSALDSVFETITFGRNIFYITDSLYIRNHKTLLSKEGSTRLPMNWRNYNSYTWIVSTQTNKPHIILDKDTSSISSWIALSIKIYDVNLINMSDINFNSNIIEVYTNNNQNYANVVFDTFIGTNAINDPVTNRTRGIYFLNGGGGYATECHIKGHIVGLWVALEIEKSSNSSWFTDFWISSGITRTYQAIVSNKSTDFQFTGSFQTGVIPAEYPYLPVFEMNEGLLYLVGSVWDLKELDNNINRQSVSVFLGKEAKLVPTGWLTMQSKQTYMHHITGYTYNVIDDINIQRRIVSIGTKNYDSRFNYALNAHITKLMHYEVYKLNQNKEIIPNVITHKNIDSLFRENAQTTLEFDSLSEGEKIVVKISLPDNYGISCARITAQSNDVAEVKCYLSEGSDVYMPCLFTVGNEIRTYSSFWGNVNITRKFLIFEITGSATSISLGHLECYTRYGSISYVNVIQNTGGKLYGEILNKDSKTILPLNYTERPTSPQEGLCIFDQEIQRPLWWDGEKWTFPYIRTNWESPLNRYAFLIKSSDMRANFNYLIRVRTNYFTNVYYNNIDCIYKVSMFGYDGSNFAIEKIQGDLNVNITLAAKNDNAAYSFNYLIKIDAISGEPNYNIHTVAEVLNPDMNISLYAGTSEVPEGYTEKISSKILLAGTTEERPVKKLTYAFSPGHQFFDTTLGKPIWWDGTNWVDATGATV